MPYLYYEPYITIVLKTNYKPADLFNKYDKKLPGETFLWIGCFRIAIPLWQPFYEHTGNFAIPNISCCDHQSKQIRLLILKKCPVFMSVFHNFRIPDQTGAGKVLLSIMAFKYARLGTTSQKNHEQVLTS